MAFSDAKLSLLYTEITANYHCYYLTKLINFLRMKAGSFNYTKNKTCLLKVYFLDTRTTRIAFRIFPFSNSLGLILSLRE